MQTFEEIIRGDYVYVDKTKFLVDLIDSGKVYFLSRPRRFGKSLTVSTFDAIFSGKKELFKGLAAEEFFERPGFATHPVISLDMSLVTTNRGIGGFDESLLFQLERAASRYNVKFGGASPSVAFSRLITSLHDELRVFI
jgi:hypothetical protein